MTKSVVLVTGGKGLVGQALMETVKRSKMTTTTTITTTKELTKADMEFIFLSSMDADLTDEYQTRRVFLKYKPDYIIHLAAKVGGLYSNMDDNQAFYDVNTAINENLLKVAHEFKVVKCISTLSTCIFPDGIECPFDETKIHLGPPHSSNWGYSRAKRNVDLLNQKYNQLGGGSLFTAVIPTNIFGPHDNFNLQHSHVIPGLIHKAYLAAIEARLSGSARTRLVVFGSGKPRRQFIYSYDLAKLILWTLNNYDDAEPLILCPDETDEISIGQVAEIICKIFSEKYGVQVDVQYDQTKSDGQLKKTAANSKLRSLYPQFKFTSFELSLRQTIDWFCDNYPNVRK